MKYANVEANQSAASAAFGRLAPPTNLLSLPFSLSFLSFFLSFLFYLFLSFSPLLHNFSLSLFLSLFIYLSISLFL